jgi:hypothetical protein
MSTEQGKLEVRGHGRKRLDFTPRKIMSRTALLLGFFDLVFVLLRFQFAPGGLGQITSVSTEISLVAPRILVPSFIMVLGALLSIQIQIGPGWEALAALLGSFAQAFDRHPAMVTFLVLLGLTIAFAIARDIWHKEIYGDLAALSAGALGSRALDSYLENLKAAKAKAKRTLDSENAG